MDIFDKISLFETIVFSTVSLDESNFEFEFETDHNLDLNMRDMRDMHLDMRDMRV